MKHSRGRSHSQVIDENENTCNNNRLDFLSILGWFSMESETITFIVSDSDFLVRYKDLSTEIMAENYAKSTITSIRGWIFLTQVQKSH